ncbi:casein kinase II, regulatory subunit [Mycena olivaceomarginata]|nr:casein kinase II, regulatory subunit [Mycena olivaceomarginata]
MSVAVQFWSESHLLTPQLCITWISWFLSSKGNEYFCEVDEDFHSRPVADYAQALNLIMDQLDGHESREYLNVQAEVLYGLIHARWVVTAAGQTKMVKKYKGGDFGRCPRVLCQSQSLLPVGLVDVPFERTVKLYCGRCEDLYSPNSSRHGSIDGAYFGTTFPHLLYLMCPALIPAKTGPPAHRPGLSENLLDVTTEATTRVALGMERCRPRIYGFQLHETAKLQRWQEATRDRQVVRLEQFE